MRDFNKWFDMDYEKAYKKALKRAKSFRTPDNKDVAAYIFPELKESREDEMIRIIKEVILKSVPYKINILNKDTTITAEEAIAWLEKQGDANKEYWRGYREGKREILDKYTELKKHGEQKPTEWSEEDEGFLNLLLAIFTNEHPNGIFSTDNISVFKGNCVRSNRIITWLKSIKERIQPQPKQEWSEEDKMQLDAAIHLVSSTGHIETANWLKSIKNRVLQQNITVTDEELAKAEKDAYNDALDKIEYHSDEPTFDDGWSAAIWYLKKKNSRPQSSWKPSNEKMEYLAKAITTLGDEGDCKTALILNDLRLELKKLREG